MNAEKREYFTRKFGPLVEFLSFEIAVQRRTKDTVGNNMNYEYEIATYNLRNESSFTTTLQIKIDHAEALLCWLNDFKNFVYFYKKSNCKHIERETFSNQKKRRFRKNFYLPTFGEK
ncbi:hypothetical protein T12_6385 [Trichinella patagoniensis]|uniref:Uncharacterized protein n=1 Tax=Trichinella patagoniensis TaxID=990121 RepID=A0A0V1A921_9BILA|nr:hypothetical protein T12_6385 [Trichinella patagoniensis]